jgi:hypothetical protein
MQKTKLMAGEKLNREAKEQIKRILVEKGNYPTNCSLEEISINDRALENIFKLNSGNQLEVVKVRDLEAPGLKDALQNLEHMNDSENIMLKPKRIIETDKVLIWINPWIEGRRISDSEPELLKNFFKALARFNKANPVTSSFTSMYLDGRRFSDMHALIEAEVHQLLEYWLEPELLPEIHSALEALHNAMPCLIQEDLNLGNILHNEGTFTVVDCE